MCRPPIRLFGRLLASVLLSLPPTSRAQPLPPEDEIDPLGIGAKEFARTAFEAEQASPRDLARARLEVARTELRVLYWYKGRLCGGPTLDSLLGAVTSVADAELAALEKPTPADRRAVLAARWLQAWTAEQNEEARYHAGRTSLASVMQPRQARLGAEIKLRQAWPDVSAPVLLPSVPFDEGQPFTDFDPKDAAKSAFEAGRADPHALATARRDAARIEFEEDLKKYVAGAPDATLDVLLKSAARLAEAELAAREKPTPDERRSVLAAHWLADWVAESIAGAKYGVGRIPVSDYMAARAARLGAEMRLKDAGEKLADPPLLPPQLAEEVDPVAGAKEAAKAAFEAGQSDRGDLAAAGRDAARVCYRVRSEMFYAGAQDATLDQLLEAARQDLGAELAASQTRDERLAAHFRYLGRMWTAEFITRLKYEVGRTNLADYMHARGRRLDAEIRLRELRDEARKK